MRSLWERLRGAPIVAQFTRYAAVGLLNTAIYFTFYNLFLALDLPTLLANALAFVITSVNSFLLNKRWAFRDERRDRVFSQYGRFLTFTVVSLVIGTVLLARWLIPFDRYGQLGKNLAALATAPFTVVWNFTAYRRWTFTAATR